MAKYSVKYACGHEGEVELYGPHKERETKMAWMETVDCPDCYAAKKFADCDEVEMSYSEYKNKYENCKTKNNSYNPKTKTIIVYVKK